VSRFRGACFGDVVASQIDHRLDKPSRQPPTIGLSDLWKQRPVRCQVASVLVLGNMDFSVR
jgi:hypothetical protein